MRELACAAAPGRPRSGPRYSITASRTCSLARLLPVMLPRSTCHGPCSGAGTWPRRRGSNAPGSRSTPTGPAPGELGSRSWTISSANRRTRPVRGPTFKSGRFADWLAEADIPWPCLDTGALALDDDTFQMMGSVPAVAPMRELRPSLAVAARHDLAIGPDGRNRCLLSAFASRTGRNQPSNARFIFGPAAWLRGLIRPSPGRAVAYVDWSQQEFGIAAALSGDPAMMAAYRSGDPYLAFGQAGRADPARRDQARPTRAEREAFKTCAGSPVQHGSRLHSQENRAVTGPRAGTLELHRTTYPKFWAWSDQAEIVGMLRGSLRTVFGWTFTPRRAQPAR